MAVRTTILDQVVGVFLDRNPGATVVTLGAGLDSRFERLKGKGVGRWYDLDVPEAIDIRRVFFSESKRNRFLSKSLFDYSWFEEVRTDGKPALIIAEGLFMYFSKDEIRHFFGKLSEHFTGGEMLFEVLAPFLVGRSNRHDSVNKVKGGIEFKWGPKDAREVESWKPGIEYLEEWNYYDYHKKRWKWFGVLGRLPVLGPALSNRIVHVRFSCPRCSGRSRGGEFTDSIG